MNEGALSVRAVATHPILCGPAMERIMQSSLTEVVVGDSVPVLLKLTTDQIRDKVRVVPLAPLFAKAIRRIHDGDSVAALCQ